MSAKEPDTIPASAPRHKKTGEGRERYLDMVQRERSLLMQQGIARSTEQLLDQAGAASVSAEESAQRSKDTATGSDHEATVVLNHSGNHRGLASAHETSPPRNLKRLSFCRSFQVANNIKLASKARPTRYPAS